MTLIHNILDNNGISDRYEHRKRAKRLSDEAKPEIRKYRQVRIDRKTIILVDVNWTEIQIKYKIEQLKKSML